MPRKPIFFDGKNGEDTIWFKYQCVFLLRTEDCEGRHQDLRTVLSHRTRFQFPYVSSEKKTTGSFHLRVAVRQKHF